MSHSWEGPVSKYLNRPVSGFISRRLAPLGVSPNKVSLAGFALSVGSAVGFLVHPAIGGILAQTSSIADGVDGEVARLQGRESKTGAFFDSVLDRYGDFFILFAMTYLASFQSSFGVVFGILSLVGSLLVSFTRAKSPFPTGHGHSWFARHAANRDVRLLIVMVGGILGEVVLSLIVLALLTNVVVLARILESLRRPESL